MTTKREYSKGCTDFINDSELINLIKNTKEDIGLVKDIIAKSLAKHPLTIKETAALLAVENPEIIEEIFDTARKLKESVYGNRIVIFAPLYIGNHCINDCSYCAFRKSIRTTVRKTLTDNEIVSEIEALEDSGHKRLILVFGEHPKYSAEFIAKTVRDVYKITKGHGEIRRVNINAAPLNTSDFKIVKDSGIGTYQIFQETYHHETYAKVHPNTTCKGDYLYRLDGLSRAFEAGCDDMGIGALFGLYDWRFEVLGLVSHSIYLQQRYGVGPHTISFPRLQPAHGVSLDEQYLVNDFDFKRLVAILRLSVPYAGMILTARESAELRREIMGFGVSQIDAGSCVELGGYSNSELNMRVKKEQFSLGDTRPIDEILFDLLNEGYIPSFCTSCYRLQRTGERFMEFAIPGFIENFCTPNAIITLEEYLKDYASEKTMKAGEKIIQLELNKISDPKLKKETIEKLNKIKNTDERDLYF